MTGQRLFTIAAEKLDQLGYLHHDFSTYQLGSKYSLMIQIGYLRGERPNLWVIVHDPEAQETSNQMEVTTPVQVESLIGMLDWTNRLHIKEMQTKVSILN